ncbi:Triphosphoribosyl-dephospho-CoA synthetase [Caballeronia glathei]|jgi:triphosphoribosyl-dephospho-CoA synthase|uniref:Probable 2-(5''-triphosphoribosyl)-3'-dephosphocoenzyme-A synthase n=1 Tax=Caballeronia glathei TaxID=60547 RepID=A0A069PTT1_9BURK|nr:MULTISPECIES: triphosphoribosyl-dephospho-CoA synthase [Burkholderiaceae]KDR40686.1 triphosphoribosyl-dephospho-CoA synthase [Caballeronia glathei]TCK35139.1 triphosphoribosyl-dephospho-CoA synthase [Paraburkholderia sp. BL8N3]CDY74926.1 Triphosphoribosyl-dephospho-CoA synthetase [Caballeronia glathei]
MRTDFATVLRPAPHAEPDLAERLAGHVVASLIDEVTLAPKPGLVDIRSRGAHDDLDWALMCTSALALQPTFSELARAGIETRPMLALRERIGAIGRDGEARMLRATGGVNTHRGAIWALGLLVTAAARDPSDLTPHGVASRAGSIAQLPDRHAPVNTGHKGEQACLSYGVSGARGEAQAGFPHVVGVALPELSRSRERGDSETAARLNALLAIVARLDDTCVLARGGRSALDETQRAAERVLEQGGAASLAGRRHLKALDRRLVELHVSPGGAADLLAAALFLDRLRDEARHLTQA